MPPRPIGDTPLTPAQRQQRHRDKLRALRDAATPPADSDAAAECSAGKSPPGGHLAIDAPDLVVGIDAVAAPPAERPGNAGRNDYPKMLYRADGATIIAQTAEEHAQRMADGWEMEPLPIHQQRPVSHHGSLGANNPLATMIREVLTAVFDEYGVGRTRDA